MMSIRHALNVLATELNFLAKPGFALLQIILTALPDGSAGRIRAAVYRDFRWRIGPRSLIMGRLTFSSPNRRNLTIGGSCYVNSHVHVDTTAAVDIGNRVTIGHHAIIITADHEIGPPSSRAGAVEPKAVSIGDGAWIAARVTLLPGVTIGEGAVVAAGSVVTRDVPAHCLVAGVPARVIRELAADEAASFGLGGPPTPNNGGAGSER